MKNTFTNSVGKGLMLLAFLLCGMTVSAQVTTSSISGLVTDSKGEGLPGATVVAVHVNSGSRYGTVTNALGRYNLPAVRVGGPFKVTVSYTGFQEQNREGIFTNLGVVANVDFTMTENADLLAEATVVAQRNDIFSSNRTGAATTFDSRTISTAPAIGSRAIGSVTKYNPNGNGSSFGGQDSRLNNFTVDGSVFNNGFGLGTDAQAGGRTGSTAISLDAIEELQVNVAPFDVRQSGFVGSGINAVTRSGTNEFSGSVYYNFRNNNMYGTKAAGRDITINKFDEKVLGARLGGPILKDKAFFFVNFEQVGQTAPAHSFVAKGSTNSGTVTRVEQSDLETLSKFMQDKFKYTTGPWENYNNELASLKFMARLDFNINNANKLTVRYTHHDSESDQLISNSNSAGAGNRRTNTNSMSFQNSGYTIQDNTRSIVADLQTTLSDKIHNNFIVGYDKQIEDRGYLSPIFPTVDILNGGSTYISVGMDPFTPANKLNYGTFHATNNTTFYMGKHTVTGGLNWENYKSNNNFFPASNGVYIFNSLADFYAAANSYLDNPQLDTSPVKINRFQYRYSALQGGAEPLQVLKVNKFDIYGQDEMALTKNFKLTVGLRAGIISFGNTALLNKAVADSTFLGLEGNRNYKINTDQMPKASILWEPRLGFNWDVTGNKTTQIRGGVGIFTGRPPYVWVSNQVGNNGVLTGFIDQTNTTKYKFTPDATIYTPATPTLPTTFDIAASDEDYKFPQIIKTNIAIDRKLPFNLVGSLEFLFNKNLNAVRYFDANYKTSTSTFTGGPDKRPKFAGNATTQRLVKNVSRAAIMTNTNEGYYFGTTFKLEYPRKNGLNAMVAYTYSQAKDLMSAGSIASGSFTGIRSVNGNNSPDLALADQDLPNRVIGLVGYRFEYGGKFGGATQISLGYVGENRAFNSTIGINTSRYSYMVGGDLNGDGISNNDIMFVPNKASDLTFEQFTVKVTDPANPTGPKIDRIYTKEEQEAAFDAFINQDPALKEQRGGYSDRNSGLFPFVHQFDLSIAQDFFIKVGGKRNAIQVRADILNFGNLVNSVWGVGNVLNTDRPIAFQNKLDANGAPVYRLATQIVNNDPVLLKDSFVKGASQFDVWAMQLGLRYTFN